MLVEIVGAPKVVVDIFFTRQPRAPRRDAAGAVVEHAFDAGAGRIGARFQPIVTACRARKLHLGFSCDAARIFRIVDDEPGAAFAFDFDDAAAMGLHRSAHEIFRHAAHGLRTGFAHGDTRIHEFVVGIFVIDDEQAMARTAVERNVTDEVVVVAKLAGLGLGRGLRGIEWRCAVEDLVAPTHQHLGIVARRDVVVFVRTSGKLREIECGCDHCRVRVSRRQQGHRRDRGGDDGRGKGPAQHIPARCSSFDNVPHRRPSRWVR